MTDRLPPRLYPIADARSLEDEGLDLVEGAVRMIEAGASWVQLRAKAMASRDWFDACRRVLDAARPRGAKVIVNDRLDIALAAGADGVHLGQGDLDPREARAIAGEALILGWSTHDLAQGLASARMPLDYVAVGPVAPTGSKDRPDPVVAPWLFAALRGALARPLVAIGGIRRESARRYLARGADSVAVISDLLRTGDPAEGIGGFLEILD